MPTESSPGAVRPEVIAPGVWRLRLPLPGAAAIDVNGYLVADRGASTLVDCGWAGPVARAALEAGLAVLGATTRDITRVIATHAHVDHYGLAGELGARRRRHALLATLARLAHLAARGRAREIERDGVVRYLAC